MADEVAVVDTNTQDSTTTEPNPEITDPKKSDAVVPRVAAPDKKADDDRQRGILADLQKERRARQELERQLTTHQADLATERRRIQALVGANPKSAEDEEADEIRTRFLGLFPQYAKLTDETIDKLLKMSESASTLEDTTQHYWKNHSITMLTALNEAVAEEIGGDLTPRQQKAIVAAYVQEAKENPEFLQRHDAGDRTLVSEFAKQWAGDWFTPAQRALTAQEVGRARRVPDGKGRHVAAGAPKKVDFTNPKALEDAFAESYKSHGGAFGD